MPIDYKNRKPKAKINDTNLHIKISTELKNKILEYSSQNNIKYSKFVRDAIIKYMEDK